MKESKVICRGCGNPISDTVQDNHGKGWAFAYTRVCNHCYQVLTH